jgi:hypothetical protein
MATMYAVGSVAAPIIGGIAGEIFGSGDRKKAQAAIAQAYKELESVGLPPDLSKALLLNHFQSAGVLTPELEQDLGDVHSQLGKFKENQQNIQAQQDALAAFKQQARGGLSAEDRLALMDIRNQAAQSAESQRQQVQQTMQARGMGGSGAELVGQLMAGQQAANLQSRENLNVAAQAQQRALAALGQQASLAGQIRGQDLTAAQATLGSEDAMAKFNRENSLARQRSNVGALNSAQVANLQNRQNLMNSNTQMDNTELQRQNEAKRQNWSDTLQYRSALANARLGQASNYQAQADRTAGQWAGVGSGIGSGFQAYNNYQQNKDYMDILKNATAAKANPTKTLSTKNVGMDAYDSVKKSNDLLDSVIFDN